MADSSTSGIASLRNSAPENEVVLQELNRILESPAFRGSERCKHFLRFIVHQTLEGKADNLKERIIGSEVFGRPPDYETAGDAIVRVKANEVRKRLAQYYAEAADRDALRVDLPAGSYVPHFEWNPDPDPQPALEPPRFPVIGMAIATPKRHVSKWWGAAVAAVIIAACVWWIVSQQLSDFDRFWRTTLSGPGVPVIYLGTSTTYMISGRVAQQLEDAKHSLDQPKPVLVAPNDVVRLSNYHVPMGNFYAIMQIASLLQRKGKPAEIRPGGELKLQDMSGRPVILIGGYSNPWALQTNAKLRFRLDDRSIHDSQDQHRVWRMEKRFPWELQTIDYALVSRVLDPTSGSVIITAAGLNVFGTQAAGEFLTRPQYWKDITQRLPAGWPSKNLQIVLEVAVVGAVPSPPKVVAAYAW